MFLFKFLPMFLIGGIVAIIIDAIVKNIRNNEDHAIALGLLAMIPAMALVAIAMGGLMLENGEWLPQWERFRMALVGCGIVALMYYVLHIVTRQPQPILRGATRNPR